MNEENLLFVREERVQACSSVALGFKLENVLSQQGEQEELSQGEMFLNCLINISL